ncbi:MAG: hypothetical protein PHC68_08125 [Syntrophorhabdaceae bacterium]|nr:hypothetical protein [Syntrophorhabdaceae bacterium]
MSKEYIEKLKDPRWQKKRLNILERDRWECMACGEKDKTLHVHHIFYLKDLDPWDIPDGMLITFCEDCHKPGPCEGNVSCESCRKKHPENNDCLGYTNHIKELHSLIGVVLNDIWTSKIIGYHGYNDRLSNAHYFLKDE